ncbi:unnamed protein product [Hermetia illucens]|uniref:Uncharacterized protein n=1 Tax=Hermetia illucens TaxID=343691 RepID=A0A7R8UF51_HERIL|nr:unnamed protein product [Hermetia illucens]
MSKRPIHENTREGTPSPQPMGLPDPKRSHSDGVDINEIEPLISNISLIHSHMDSPELPSSDEEEDVAAYRSQERNRMAEASHPKTGGPLWDSPGRGDTLPGYPQRDDAKP